MKEVELYRPVKDLLTGLGYTVKAEVDNIDVVAMKESEWAVVELKTSFTLKLLLQATQRQKLAEKVYVAIPAPSGRQRFSKGFKEYEHLLKRLELGLILVHFKETPRAELVFEPKEYARGPVMSRNRKKSAAVLREAEGRHDDYNVGGTNGKLVTVYREKALLAASCLSAKGPLSVKELREITGNEKMLTLLRNNHYGWFENISRGIYGLSPAGEEALEAYGEVVTNLMREARPATATAAKQGPCGSTDGKEEKPWI
jgi:hypothetical protein